MGKATGLERFFHDQHEELRAVLGQGYITSFLQGSLSKGLLFLTDMRLYQEGKIYFRGADGSLLSKKGSSTVHVRDITGFEFNEKNHPGILTVAIFFFLAAVVLWVVLINEQKNDLMGVPLIPLFLGIIFLIWYNAVRSRVFIVKFAGGEMAVDCRWYTEEELRQFQKQISVARDARDFRTQDIPPSRSDDRPWPSAPPPQPVPLSPRSYPSTGPPVDDQGTVQCSICDTQNPPGARFCDSCGSALYEQCPKCGKQFASGKKFCRFCGVEIAAFRAFQDHIARGRDHLSACRFNEAALEFRSALEFKPASQGLQKLLIEAEHKEARLQELLRDANSAYSHKDYIAATTLFRKALELNPQSKEIAESLSSIPAKIKEDSVLNLMKELERLYENHQFERVVEIAAQESEVSTDSRVLDIREKANLALRKDRITESLAEARAALAERKYKSALNSLEKVRLEDENSQEALILRTEVNEKYETERAHRKHLTKIVGVAILGIAIVAAASIGLMRRHRSALTEKAAFYRAYQGLVPASYVSNYPDGAFRAQAQFLIDSLDAVWKQSKRFEMIDTALVKQDFLRFALQALLRKSAKSQSDVTFTYSLTSDSASYSSDRETTLEPHWYVWIEGIGDPDGDGYLEATLTAENDNHRGTGRDLYFCPVLEYRPAGPREDDWATIDSTFNQWVQTSFPNRSFVRNQSRKIGDGKIRNSFYVFYPGDPNCCARFQASVSLEFGRGSRARVVENDILIRGKDDVYRNDPVAVSLFKAIGEISDTVILRRLDSEVLTVVIQGGRRSLHSKLAVLHQNSGVYRLNFRDSVELWLPPEHIEAVRIGWKPYLLNFYLPVREFELRWQCNHPFPS